MKIRVRKKEKEYAQVHRNLLFNKTMSIQAKGIGAIIECYSDNFELANKSLEINANLSSDTLRKYLKELEKNIYLYRIQLPRKNFSSIWFFDSEILDLKFVYDEILKIKKTEAVIKVTAYEISVDGKIDSAVLDTYNNTNTDESKFSSQEALNIMYQVQEEKTKKQRAYTQKPRSKVTAHDTVRSNYKEQNNISTHSTHNFVPKFVPNDNEINF